MEKVYEPKLCRDDVVDGKEVPKKYEGNVTFKVPGVIEHLQLLREVRKQKGVDERDSNILSLVAGLEALPRYIMAVNLIRLKDGKTFSSLESLMTDVDNEDVCVDLSNQLVGGFKVSGE